MALTCVDHNKDVFAVMWPFKKKKLKPSVVLYTSQTNTIVMLIRDNVK